METNFVLVVIVLTLGGFNGRPTGGPKYIPQRVRRQVYNVHLDRNSPYLTEEAAYESTRMSDPRSKRFFQFPTSSRFAQFEPLSNRPFDMLMLGKQPQSIQQIPFQLDYLQAQQSPFNPAEFQQHHPSQGFRPTQIYGDYNPIQHQNPLIDPAYPTRQDIQFFMKNQEPVGNPFYGSTSQMSTTPFDYNLQYNSQPLSPFQSMDPGYKPFIIGPSTFGSRQGLFEANRPYNLQPVTHTKIVKPVSKLIVESPRMIDDYDQSLAQQIAQLKMLNANLKRK
ncbi:hypothetical protein ACOME3_006886 [Neoechinorhynchus agilis]